MNNAMLPGLGGPMGRHARPRGVWFNPLPWVVLAATLLFLALFLRHVPCVQTDAGNAINAYIRACYSDIQTTFLGQKMGQGASPVNAEQLLFSPLVAVVVLLTSRVASRFCGAPVTRSASLQDQVDASVTFFGLTAVGLFACFLVWVLATAWLGRPAGQRRTSWDAMLVAASPIVLATGLVSWDLLPIAVTALGLVQVARGRLPEAGIVLGLAACAGTMPIGVVLAVLVAVGLRGGWRKATAFGLAAVVTFFAVHLPLLLANFDRVYAYYHHEIHKDVGYGSPWYLAHLMGVQLRHIGSLAFIVLVLALAALIAWLYVAGRRPRVGSMVAAVVLLTALLGPAFPPQVAPWLLLAVVLARPYRPELIALTVTQVGYYLAIWGWLGGSLTSNQHGPYFLYWLAIVGHAAVEAWILIEVILDMALPSRDALRIPNVPDPIGGVLNDGEGPGRISGEAPLSAVALDQ